MNETRHRLFFSLNPSQELIKKIKDIQRPFQAQFNARWIPAENMHLTLCFIGNVTEETKNCLQEQAKQVKFDVTSIELNRLGQFKKSEILWLAPRETNIVLDMLYKNLCDVMRDCNLQPEKRKFKPHLTLARRFRGVCQYPNNIHLLWRVEKFYLMESVLLQESVCYKVVQEYPVQ